MATWRSWRPKVRRPSWGGPALADEASAFLDGRLQEHLFGGAGGRHAPPWVWLNAVAHGDATLLQQIVDTAGPPADPILDWGEARAALAGELLARAGDDRAVVQRLQREVLVPLEQNLADATELTPARLYEIAVDEMRLIGS